MKRVTWLAALVLLVTPSTLAVTCSPAWACACLQESDAQRFESSSHVFVGTPTSSRMDDSNVYWTFEVEEFLKGKASGELEIAVLRSDVDDCGYELELGRRYQIFAYEFGSELRSGKCSGNRPLDDAEPFEPTKSERRAATGDATAPAPQESLVPVRPPETVPPAGLASDEQEGGGIPGVVWPIAAGLLGGIGYWSFRRRSS